MSVSIRLKRLGSKARPYYRIVVLDSRSARDGQALEELGFFHPIEAEEKQIRINEESARKWLACGAQPSDTVRHIFNKKGIHLPQ